MAATVDYRAAYADTTNTDVYTFSSADIGTAASDRYVVCVCHQRKAGTAAASLTSATIAGVSASIPVQEISTTSNSNLVAIIIAAVPTGTTGDVVLTWSVSGVDSAIEVYAVYGIDGATAHDTDQSAASDPSLSLNVEAGGIVIGGGTCSLGTSGAWTGITEDNENISGTMYYGSASDAFASASTPLAVTLTWSGSDVQTATVVASWSPAAVGGGGNPWNYYAQAA